MHNKSERKEFYDIFNTTSKLSSDMRKLITDKNRNTPRFIKEAFEHIKKADLCLSEVLLIQQWVEGSNLSTCNCYSESRDIVNDIAEDEKKDNLVKEWIR